MVPKVQVTVCDVCKRVGVETRVYTITQGERSAETDRCQDHSQPFEEVLEPGKCQVKGVAGDLPDSTVEPAAAPLAPAKKAPAKTAAKKAPAKRTARAKTPAKKAAAQGSQSPSGGRGPVMTTIEAIDASKKP
ncbi:hypothetical protein Q3V23_23195 [Streptomyces sp. VNUA116]|uniref:hypothetical protein n=1 Tax=Streptomyces sp. VNUA116 TaxID=3062449 RepID=UPI0026760073|nr:hypothetical protein [Streptomyces sp. VNUA116]WKU46731.1 hypothetical protein Q3V23_23195 [Streptomyces sp. VNUA116]